MLSQATANKAERVQAQTYAALAFAFLAPSAHGEPQWYSKVIIRAAIGCASFTC